MELGKLFFLGLLFVAVGCGSSTAGHQGTGGAAGGKANGGSGGAANGGTGGAAGGKANGGNGGAANGGSGNPTTCSNPTVYTNWPFGGACATCMVANCSSVVDACYGSGWRSADFGGACGPWLQCECNCPYPSGDTTCLATCDAKHTQDCWSAQNVVQTCETQRCYQTCIGTQAIDAGP